MDEPRLKELIEKANEKVLGGKLKELEESLNEIKAWGEEEGRVAEAEQAIKDVKADMEKTVADFTKKIDRAQRAAFDASGRYRGVFASEDNARSFGLVALQATAEHGKKAQEILETDYKDLLDASKREGDPHAGETGLVGHTHLGVLERLVEDYGAARRISRVLPVPDSTGTWHRRAAGLRARKTKIRNKVDEQTAGWSPLSWSIFDLDVLTSYPISLSEDMIVPFAELLAEEMALGFAIAEDEDLIVGDASDNYDNISGITHRLTQINGADDGGGLVLASGNTGDGWSGITKDDIFKMIGLARYVRAGMGRLVGSNEFFWTVLAKLITDAGGRTVMESQRGLQLNFFGVPYEPVPVMPRTEGNSQVPLLYGDFQLSSTIYDRRQMVLRESREVRFESKEVVLLATERVDMDNHTLGDDETPGPVVGLVTPAAS